MLRQLPKRLGTSSKLCYEEQSHRPRAHPGAPREAPGRLKLRRSQRPPWAWFRSGFALPDPDAPDPDPAAPGPAAPLRRPHPPPLASSPLLPPARRSLGQARAPPEPPEPAPETADRSREGTEMPESLPEITERRRQRSELPEDSGPAPPLPDRHRGPASRASLSGRSRGGLKGERGGAPWWRAETAQHRAPGSNRDRIGIEPGSHRERGTAPGLNRDHTGITPGPHQEQGTHRD